MPMTSLILKSDVKFNMPERILMQQPKRVTSAAELRSLFTARMAQGALGLASGEAQPLLRIKSLFISDTHLGMRGTAADELTHLLEHCECERLIMIGDIIDGWALGRHWNWKHRQETAFDAILMKAAKPSCDVVYIPGNHDEFWRIDLPKKGIGGVRFLPNVLIEMADGRSFWVSHGDEHDTVTNHATWLSQFGSMLYEGGIHASKGFKRMLQMIGFKGFSASQELKNLVKYVVQPPKQFEEKLGQDARVKGASGVLCGHIHRPELKQSDAGMTYANTGDFVESASAIVEDFDGRLSLIYWSHKVGLVKQVFERKS